MARKSHEVQRRARPGLNVLMLATDAHGGFGGIAQYNRDVIEALSRDAAVSQVEVLPRIIQDPVGQLPPKIIYDPSSMVSMRNFIVSSAKHALPGKRLDVVYCAHINLIVVAAAIASARRCPLVLAIYGIDAWQKPKGIAIKAAVRSASLVISISQITLDRFLAWSGFDEKKCAVLPNAVHTEYYGAGSKNSPLALRLGVASRPVILTFGRMSADERYKGFDEVIDAMPKLLEQKADLVYVAAGDGSDRQRLEIKAASLGVAASVMFSGRISEAEKADLYRLSDAFVMPSSGEGFGFVVLEALACGIPVVASTADGTREAVRGGELGRCVDPSDRAGLVNSILEALSRPKMILPGLDYFSFTNFEMRLAAALRRVVAAA